MVLYTTWCQICTFKMSSPAQIIVPITQNIAKLHHVYSLLQRKYKKEKLGTRLISGVPKMYPSIGSGLETFLFSLCLCDPKSGCAKTHCDESAALLSEPDPMNLNPLTQPKGSCLKGFFLMMNQCLELQPCMMAIITQSFWDSHWLGGPSYFWQAD